MLFLGLVGGTVLSIPLAFAADAMGTGYRSAQDVEFDTGLPVLAHVPKVQGPSLRGKDLASYSASKPDSVFTEAIRLLCARLLASTSYHLHQSIVFVSSKAGEGKTTITLAVARALARSGRKVVVVDADFRCGKVADMLELRRGTGAWPNSLPAPPSLRMSFSMTAVRPSTLSPAAPTPPKAPMTSPAKFFQPSCRTCITATIWS